MRRPSLPDQNGQGMEVSRNGPPDGQPAARPLKPGIWNRVAMTLAMLLVILGFSLQWSAGIQFANSSQTSVQSGGDTLEDGAAGSALAVTTAPEEAAAATPREPAPAQQPAGSETPAASPPQRISYPEAGIDVAVHPLAIDLQAQASQSIIPPYTLDGYWLSPFGSPGLGSENTTYIVGHSWDDREAPFNRLSDSAEAGDTFTVTTATGVLDYRVQSVFTLDKSTLKDSDIWAVLPNRLVLISCYTEDPLGKNVIVTAAPLR